ncbi:MAG: transglutaminase domain-containing protein [Acidobacteria bacterium]|nr:MAG: transglutaminase domain-containing protein [Acidobacteriota bacterium]
MIPPAVSRGVLALRACVMGLALALLAWPLSVWTGVAAATLAAACGVVAGEATAHSRLRLSSGLLLAALTAAAGIAVARSVVDATLFAGLLGPVATLHLSEALLWLAIALPATLALRLVALRRPALAVIEVGAVALAVVAAVAAHRGGMVHRPYAIGDWAWSRGIDPGVVLLAVGALASFVLAALLFSRRSPDAVVQAARGRRPADDDVESYRRLPLHFAALAVLALFLLLVIRATGPPAPKAAGDLGLTGDPAEEEQDGNPQRGRGGGGSQRAGEQLGDIPFRDEYSSTGNQAPVAVAVLHDDYSPPSGVYYFRQSAFSQYNGRRLVQATRDDVDRDIVARFPSRPLVIPSAPAVGRARRALPTSIGLLADHVRPFALDSPVRLEPLHNDNPTRFRRVYAARSHVQTVPYEAMLGRRPGNASWSDEQWRHYTEAPSDPRYRELAESLLARLKPDYRDDPLAQALVVKDYLDKNGIYSRKSQHAGASDPAASFLFGDLTGYCVHFAHAAAYLLRSLDVPARVAAGYAVPESDRGGGSALLIRGANAHAWPEIQLDGLGWVVVDLAPEQSLDEPISAPDQALQRMLGEMMRQQQMAEFDQPLTRPIDFGRLARQLLLVILAALLAAYAIKIYRQVLPHLAPAPALPRVGYRAALDQLAEAGLRRRFGESREHFARRARSLTPSFFELSRWHLGWALGSRRGTSPVELRRLTDRVRRELDQSLPAWRRLLGIIHPFSWLRAR